MKYVWTWLKTTLENNMKLYTKTGCPPCERVKAFIEKNDITQVEIVNISTTPGILTELKERGMRTVPTLEVDDALISDSELIINLLGGLHG